MLITSGSQRVKLFNIAYLPALKSLSNIAFLPTKYLTKIRREEKRTITLLEVAG